jgi:phosphate ABC transporter phosphate-binding protein
MIPRRLQQHVSKFLLLAISVFLAILPSSSASASDYVPVNGGGSSWSANAVDQWRRNVQQFGMRVNYASTGSSDGRNQFRNGTLDFASSEIPYGLKDGNVVDTPPSIGFAYMPLVAGGTAFMYNLEVGGKRLTNLKLSGELIVKIFTGVITMWNDPAIAKANPGISLPARKIIPVVRSDGSGSTAQLTTWMASEYSTLWDAYCRLAGRATPCGLTSNYPLVSGKGFVSQPNSQGVSGYVSQSANIGTITYVEYSYALKTNFPVVKVLNAGGYYVLPTASNVAVALLDAEINTTRGPEYLTQILTGVYRSTDPRSYPLSSYSYLIVPTEVAGSFTAAKGKTLSAFANYFLCEGQQQAEVLGYSPLPINLVQAGLEQVRLIPGAEIENINIQSCNNPTFSSDGTNTLAENAPMPSASDKFMAGPGSGTTTGSNSGSEEGTTNGSGSSAGQDGESTSGGSTSGGSTTIIDATSASEKGPVKCDADTGACTYVAAIAVDPPSSTGWSFQNTQIVIASMLFFGLVIGPPLLNLLLRKKRT